ncbi:hypothetical protein RQP46_002687 [Phenoliferia psychrophenolica]
MYPIHENDLTGNSGLERLTEEIQELTVDRDAPRLSGGTIGDEFDAVGILNAVSMGEEEHHQARVWKINGVEAESIGMCEFVITSRFIDGKRDHTMTAWDIESRRLAMNFLIKPGGKPIHVVLEKAIMEKPHPPKEIRALKLTYISFDGEVDGHPQRFRLGLTTWEEARDLRKRLEALTKIPADAIPTQVTVD